MDEVEFLLLLFAAFPGCEFVDPRFAERYRELLLEYYKRRKA